LHQLVLIRVFFYGSEAFNDFILRLQFRLVGPIGSFGKSLDNSGVFVRFHYPHQKGPDLPTNTNPALAANVASDAAWIAGYTGFEIQIDDNAAPDGADKHRTAAIYNVPTGPGGLQSYKPGPVLQLRQWHDMEITLRGNRYSVMLNGIQTTDFVNPLTK
jgi:3-keto-disaccharide hydrolase